MSDESDASPPGSPVPSPVASIASIGSPTASPKPSTPPSLAAQAEPPPASAHRKTARASLPNDFGALVPVGSKRPAHELAAQRAKANGPAPKKLAMPSTPVDLEADGRPALLQSTERADADELYTEQEKALSEYLKLHPMLSLRVYAHSNPHLPCARLRMQRSPQHRMHPRAQGGHQPPHAPARRRPRRAVEHPHARARGRRQGLRRRLPPRARRRARRTALLHGRKVHLRLARTLALRRRY